MAQLCSKKGKSPLHSLLNFYDFGVMVGFLANIGGSGGSV